MGSARGGGFAAIIVFLVAAAFSHWIWIGGADVQLPGISDDAYSYNFMLGPFQPDVEFRRLDGKSAAKKDDSWKGFAKSAVKSAASAGIGAATGSRSHLWHKTLNKVTSYSELKIKVCAGDYSNLATNVVHITTTVVRQATSGPTDCATTHTLQYLGIGSMLFLALAVLFAVLGLIQHFTGKIVDYRWENALPFSVAACCAIVMMMQMGAAVSATSLIYTNRWFKFIPYFGMLWNLVAFVLAFVLVSPCCSGRQPLLEKGDEEQYRQGQYQQGQHQQGQHQQGQHQQGQHQQGQYGAQGQYPQQGYGHGAPGQYSQPQQPQQYY